VQQSEEEIKNIKIIENDFAIVMQRDLSKKTPIWILVLASLGGILLLAILTFVFYKFGFFTRKVKQELKQKKRETLAAAGQSNPTYESAQELT
jgi:hypothetical protein